MMTCDYAIQPTLMMGVIKEIQGETVTIHLRGRLGVITVDKQTIKLAGELAIGSKVQFYFSYIQVVETVYDYDASIVNQAYEMSPGLLYGRVSHVDDTAVQVAMAGDLGTIVVPRRWVFTNKKIANHHDVEFYFSYMQVIG